MNQEIILTLAKNALQTTLLISGPMLIVALAVGIFISIAQVVTSISDMTLSFVPRIIAVFVTFLLIFPWIMNTMLDFTINLYGHLESFVR
jgi:flagellar biosynthetic protein FliQ